MSDKLETLEPGELQLRKAFEDTTTQNVKTIIDYSTQTRDLIREAEKSIKELKNMIVTRDSDIAELRQQVSILQSKIYLNGTV